MTHRIMQCGFALSCFAAVRAVQFYRGSPRTWKRLPVDLVQLRRA